ncbi:hypothetical protein [Barnesiella intestinihominis]|uniref:hypothetical protein n=1 Tax=Barnesiella intestinihominis TaxID=487174 RepID=UPI00388DAB82
MSRFVHQQAILQHYKSPLLCNGVTDAQRGKAWNPVGGRQACRLVPTPIRQGRIFDFRQKIARCVSWHTKPFSVPENALPLAGVKATPKS